jgi:negative regulator of replication initiation
VARPKLPEWRRRDYELRIKLDRVERLFLAEQCAREGESLSEYVRRLINRELAAQPSVEVYDDYDRIAVGPEGEPILQSYKQSLRDRVSRMSADALNARVNELLDFTEYEDGDE